MKAGYNIIIQFVVLSYSKIYHCDINIRTLDRRSVDVITRQTDLSRNRDTDPNL